MYTKKSSKNIYIEEKVIIRLTFKPGWALTGFRTILPCAQQVNRTRARDPIEKPAAGQRSTSKNTWPRWAVNLSPQYGHVILDSGYLVLTDVSWSYHGSSIPKKYTVNQGGKSLSTCYLEYGRHILRLRRRRRRVYAPTSNTASHDNHEKINSWVSFCFPYMGCLWASAIIASVSPTKITRSHGPITLWMWMFSTLLHLLVYSLTAGFCTISQQFQSVASKLSLFKNDPFPKLSGS